MKLSGKTKVYGIIGDPVTHSLSPLFQGRFAAEAGIDAVYVPFAVAAADLHDAVVGLRAVSVQGFNVTVPHKEAVLPLIECDENARIIGAVNTVVRKPEGWLGTNTDWQGFAAAVRQLSAASDRVLLFGAGGTARAVLHALAHMGCRHVSICNRSEERLHALMAHVHRHYPKMECAAVPWREDEVLAAAGEADLIVNTTSIGLHGEKEFPFALTGRGKALDAVYCADGLTPFVQAAKRAGLEAMDGLYMLVAQGAASFCCWHGRMPDVAATMDWLQREIGRKGDSAAALRDAVEDK